MPETTKEASATSTKETKAEPLKVEVHVPSVNVRTPDDAVFAYLNGHIDEKKLRDLLASYGVTSLGPVKVERVDAAYERKIPDDLFDVPTSPYDDYEYRKDQLDEKQKVRDEAIKKTENENRDQTVARETAALVETKPEPVKRS